MTHPLELAASDAIRSLRSCPLVKQVQSNVPVTPGLFFGWDEEEGQVDLHVSSDAEKILDIGGTITKTPRWLGLNLLLGKSAFAPGAIIGVIAELEGAEGHEIPLVMRSTKNDKNRETVLQESFWGAPTREVRTVLHTVEVGEVLADAPSFHTLVMRLPKQDFNLTIYDLRVFVIPATRGFRSIPKTLSQPGA